LLSARQKADRVASLMAAAVGLLLGAFLILEADPVDGPPGKTITVSSSIASGCSKRCDNPDSTEITITQTSGSGDSETSLEGVFDGWAGAVLSCLVAALLTALLTYLTTRRIAEGIFEMRRGPSSKPKREAAEITMTQTVLISLTAGRSSRYSKARDRAKEMAEESGGVPELAPTTDPNAALATLRDDVASSVRELAERIGGVDERLPIERVVDALTSNHAIDPEVKFAILGLLELADRAAEGARIDPAAGDWIRSEGQRLLAALRVLFGEARS
jgi:hypothetical protein